MICPQCGADITGGAELCPRCGERAPDPSAGLASPTPVPVALRQVVYAGFWRRAAAYVFDILLLSLLLNPLILEPLIARNGISPEELYSFSSGHARQIFAMRWQ